jgi:hypothetical protein
LRLGCASGSRPYPDSLLEPLPARDAKQKLLAHELQGEIHFCPARSTPEFYFVFKPAQKFLWL